MCKVTWFNGPDWTDRARRGLFLLLIPILFSACVASRAMQPTTLSGIDGIRCVGEIDSPPAGLIEVDDKQLLHKALAASGKGKLCAGRVYRATRPVTVYRVWDAAKAYTLYGSWWSLHLPQGPRERYREENDICPAWSALDRMSACKLKTGAKIVVGPGQSADCASTTLAKSAANQVFIPNDALHGTLFVEDCAKGTPWP